jgi:hypothetical protein
MGELAVSAAEETPAQAICEYCHQPYTRVRARQRFCGKPKRCAKRASAYVRTRRQKTGKGSASGEARPCMVCGETYRPYRPNSRLCSDRCRKDYANAAMKRRRKEAPETTAAIMRRHRELQKARAEVDPEFRAKLLETRRAEEQKRRDRRRAARLAKAAARAAQAPVEPAPHPLSGYAQGAKARARRELRLPKLTPDGPRKFFVMASESRRRSREREAAQAQDTSSLPPPHKVLHGLWLYHCPEYDAHMTPSHCAFNRGLTTQQATRNDKLSLGGKPKSPHASLYGEEIEARAIGCKGCPGVVALARGEQRERKIPAKMKALPRCKHCGGEYEDARRRSYCGEFCQGRAKRVLERRRMSLARHIDRKHVK